MKNTKKKGIYRFFIYYDKNDKEFVGVCIELGIIKVGKDPEEVQEDLNNAALGYIKAVVKDNLPDKLLNQEPPKKYLDIYKQIIEASAKRKIPRKIDLNESFAFARTAGDLCPAT